MSIWAYFLGSVGMSFLLIVPAEFSLVWADYLMYLAELDDVLCKFAFQLQNNKAQGRYRQSL
jgi:hypothetical protein